MVMNEFSCSDLYDIIKPKFYLFFDPIMFDDKIEDDKITVDANHPLAGETLHFSVSIEEIRDANKEELSHGHVHAPGGHSH